MGGALVRTIQLLDWLVLQPSGWHRYTSRLGIRPNFCLAELRGHQRHQPEIRQLIALEYGVLPVLVGGSVALALGLLGLHSPNITWQDVIFGSCVGFAASLGSAIAGSLVISVAASWLAAVAGGLISGLIFGWMGVDSLLAFRSGLGASSADLKTLAEAMWPPILMASFPNGVAAGVALNLEKANRRYALGQTLGGVVLGVLGSGLLLGAGSSLTRYLMAQFPIEESHAAIWEPLIFSGLLGAGFGLIGARYSRRWKREIGIGALVGVGVVLLAGLGANTAQPVLRGWAIGGGNALLLTALFALAYALASAISGVRAGAIAGVLGSSSIHTLFISVLTGYPIGPTLCLSLLCTAAGLTLPLWLPFLLYPFESLWSVLLYRFQENQSQESQSRAKEEPPLKEQSQPRKHLPIRWHAAFWDEQQRLPLWGLDQYLVNVVNRDAHQGEIVMERLSQGHQRWAVQAAQQELDAQQLERCQEVGAIAALHQHFNLSNLSATSAASTTASTTATLLLSFKQLSEDTQAALNQSSPYSQRLMLSTLDRQITGLLQSFARNHTAYPSRFRPILQSWQHILSQYQQHLIDQAQQSQTIDSPYIVGIPLTPQQDITQDIFVGRQDISAKIEQLLREQRHTSLLLYGQRRMGKTSLLNNLGRLLPHHIVPLFIDLQGPTAQSANHAGFFYNLARGMVRSAQQTRHLSFPPLSRETLSLDPFTVFDEWLDQVEAVLGDRTALLTLDEFEALDHAFTTGRLEDNAILGMLRNLIQHRPKFKVLLSGSHTLEGFHHWASYLINLQVVRITYLTDPEARRLIEQPIQNFALRYHPAATQRVLALTHAHPFLIQLLCAEIIALKNEQPPATRRQVTAADVEAAIPPALISGSFFFADIEQTQHSTSPLLRHLAQQTRDQPYSPTSPQETEQLEHMVKQEILAVTESGYQFQVELIRQWFAQR